MSFTYYIANGYTSRSKAVGEYHGMSEFRLRNLAERNTTIRQRLFFSDRPPLDLPPITTGPMGGPYQEFPKDLPQSHKDAGPWGAQIISDTPLAYFHISLARRNGQTDKHAYGGGCGMQLGKPHLSKAWYFGDCFKWFVPAENPPFPFSQYEWYHVLNPNPRPAAISLTIGDDKHDRDRTHRLTIDAQRVLFIDDPDLVEGTMRGCYAKFESDQPILVEAERAIFSPKGPDDWGVVLGCASPGAAEPFIENSPASPL